MTVAVVDNTVVDCRNSVAVAATIRDCRLALAEVAVESVAPIPAVPIDRNRIRAAAAVAATRTAASVGSNRLAAAAERSVVAILSMAAATVDGSPPVVVVVVVAIRAVVAAPVLDGSQPPELIAATRCNSLAVAIRMVAEGANHTIMAVTTDKNPLAVAEIVADRSGSVADRSLMLVVVVVVPADGIPVAGTLAAGFRRMVFAVPRRLQLLCQHSCAPPPCRRSGRRSGRAWCRQSSG